MEQMRNEINELIEQSKQKAKVLTEALPYIRRFNNCYVVVKYGGSAMKDKNLQKSVIRDVALLNFEAAGAGSGAYCGGVGAVCFREP